MAQTLFQQWLATLEAKGAGAKAFLADPYWWAQYIAKPRKYNLSVTSDANLRIGLRINSIPCLIFVSIPNPTEEPADLTLVIRRGDLEQETKPEQDVSVADASAETLLAAVDSLVTQQTALM